MVLLNYLDNDIENGPPKILYAQKINKFNKQKKIRKFSYQQTMDFLDYFLRLDQENTLQILLQDLPVVVRIKYLQPISKTNDAFKFIYKEINL